MFVGKDALYLVLALVSAVIHSGCRTSPRRQGENAEEAKSVRPLVRAKGPPIPDLRIPANPVPAPIPARPEFVQLTGASVPADASAAQTGSDNRGPQQGSNPEQNPANPADPVAKLRAIYQVAQARYAQMDSYIVRLRRREQIKGVDKPEEILLLKFRKDPWSVYLKWLGTVGQGREVLFVKGHYGNKIHTLLASGDVPLMAAGSRLALSPDNPLVHSSSRHSIEETGFGVLIDHMGVLLKANEARPGSIRYLGLVKRPEFPAPYEAAEETIWPGSDPSLPRGGKRYCLFEPVNNFPALVITHNETGHEVEYYCYDRFQFPVRLDQDDFNPQKLWSRKP